MRRALLIGINDYAEQQPLLSCVADVEALAPLLERNEDGSVNFKCERLTSAGPALVTRALLRQKLSEHLDSFDGDVLIYFSGHGAATTLGGHLVTYESSQYEPGLPMAELVHRTRQSKAKNVFIILDCCYAGAAGDDHEVVGNLENEAMLREGVTILAASRPRQKAIEAGRHGAFTRLVLSALSGGAADVRGQVSAAAIYAYAEAVLGALEQRPLYKSHAASLEPVRHCLPAVPDAVLRQLPDLFLESNSLYKMGPAYERTHPAAIPEHVATFQMFKQLQVARLLRCVAGRDMYDTAMASDEVLLTPLGQFYWELAKAGQI
jgi:hypothetical protein